MSKRLNVNVENIINMIEDAIQNELGYEKDNITNDGWSFLEDDASKLVLNRIMEEIDEEELGDITSEDVQRYLNDVIYEYEQNHANIRYYD